jgi:hypothetical protein
LEAVKLAKRVIEVYRLPNRKQIKLRCSLNRCHLTISIPTLIESIVRYNSHKVGEVSLEEPSLKVAKNGEWEEWQQTRMPIKEFTAPTSSLEWDRGKDTDNLVMPIANMGELLHDLVQACSQLTRQQEGLKVLQSTKCSWLGKTLVPAKGRAMLVVQR